MIKEIRKSRGMTQAQLALAVGTSKSYICQLENGSRDILNIREDTMQRLCNALGCTPKDLTIGIKINHREYHGICFTEVDGLYVSSENPNTLFISINGRIFEAKYTAYDLSQPLEEQMIPIANPLPDDVEEASAPVYLSCRAVPKAGFDKLDV